MRKLAVEALGTFCFILTILMTKDRVAIACMLMAWVYIGGFISGGHYNPMVSLAIALRGKLPWNLLPSYMLAQITGGFIAFLTTAWLKGSVAIPQPTSSFLPAFTIEVLLALVLALIILVVATSEKFKGSDIFGLAIGFTIPALVTIGKPITGGLFNPAIALGGAGYSLVKGIPIIWEHLALYVIGAFLGGILASSLYNFFFRQHLS